MTSSLMLNRPVVITGRICDGPISDFVYHVHVTVYQCTKFGAFITKCTMVCYAAPLPANLLDFKQMSNIMAVHGHDNLRGMVGLFIMCSCRQG